MHDKSRAHSSSYIAMAAAVALVAAVAGLAYIKRDVTPLQQQQRQERLETELITLQPTGFEPNEIQRPEGAFILGVDNRSGVEAIELRVVRANGQRLSVLESRKRKSSWREVIDLAPGQYVLSEASRPDWTCTVTIVPR